MRKKVYGGGGGQSKKILLTAPPSVYSYAIAEGSANEVFFLFKQIFLRLSHKKLSLSVQEGILLTLAILFGLAFLSLLNLL